MTGPDPIIDRCFQTAIDYMARQDGLENFADAISALRDEWKEAVTRAVELTAERDEARAEIERLTVCLHEVGNGYDRARAERDEYRAIAEGFQGRINTVVSRTGGVESQGWAAQSPCCEHDWDAHDENGCQHTKDIPNSGGLVRLCPCLDTP